MTINKKKIHIIDDQPEILEILEGTLSSLYDIITFTDPQHALAQFKENPKSCDLIIIDYLMPEMTGADFLQSLRADGYMTPIIFMSGNVDLDFALTALRLGASDIVLKPMDDHQFLESVARVLNIESRKARYYSLDKEHRAREPVLGLLQVANSQLHKKKSS